MSVTPPVCEEVAEGVVALIQAPGTLGLSNSVIVAEGGRGLVLDTMLLPEMSRSIVDTAARMGTRIDTVLHSHHHVDHCGGNSVFGAARVVAHPQTVADIKQMLDNITVFDWLMPQFAGRFADLDVRIPEPVDLQTLEIPGNGQLLVFGPSHSSQDVALWFPGPRLLLSADLCMNGVTPLAIHGSQVGWAETLEHLSGLKPDIVVPGHGPVTTAKTLDELRDYLLRLTATAESAVRAGATVDEALAEFDSGPVAGWLDGERTRQNLTRAVDEARERAGYLPGVGPLGKNSTD
ncbi:MAG: MBL fold metallo-hydrolase [Actinomycetota bacterium]|nr:MBL fold metallo-hydrolase [Actinomycetota bacterium]